MKVIKQSKLYNTLLRKTDVGMWVRYPSDFVSRTNMNNKLQYIYSVYRIE